MVFCAWRADGQTSQRKQGIVALLFFPFFDLLLQCWCLARCAYLAELVHGGAPYLSALGWRVWRR